MKSELLNSEFAKAKTCKNASKNNHNVGIIKEDVLSSNFESYMLKENFKNNKNI